jgi:polysaccharide deacetylase 2 family uncharacterized protein YibQ
VYYRDTFLDNRKDSGSIRRQFQELLRKSALRGYGIGIGHVQTPALAAVLKEYANDPSLRFCFPDELKPDTR